jgi:hypothetical protein
MKNAAWISAYTAALILMLSVLDQTARDLQLLGAFMAAVAALCLALRWRLNPRP